jgi:hypothetical protein
MSILVFAFARELLGRWGLPLLVAGLFGAAQLGFDATLGDATMGTYLAYVSLWPIALIFRCGWLLQQRRGHGWPLEEHLRDPVGHRAPLSEFAAVALLTAVGLLAALLPPLFFDAELQKGAVGLYPVRLESDEDGQWLVDVGATVPQGSTLLLTLDWSDHPGSATELPIVNPLAEQETAVAGKILRWPLRPGELRAGTLVLRPPEGSRLRPFRDLARLEIPRPDASRLGDLLVDQLLFFLPLLAMLLALTRSGRINAKLAAWAVFFLGSLVAYHPPRHLAAADLGMVAKFFLLLKSSLPAVEGLVSSGHRFERLAGTTSAYATASWLILGILALLLACRRRKAR